MKHQFIVFFFLLFYSTEGYSQEINNKKRLDFAKTYFELGGSISPSFTGKRLLNNEITSFENPASFNSYLTWGGFHFWGHAEFYVTFPLNQLNFKKSESTDFKLNHAVVTGARFLPWAFQEKKIRPYMGLSWSALGFQQKIEPKEDQPTLTKDFLLVPEAGLMYGYKAFTLRLGVHYFHDNKWNYPVSKTTFSEIETPKFNFQIGLNYSFDASKNNKNPETNKRWNSYPHSSKPSYGTTKFGDFFIGIGPSSSFSLSKSEYNQINFPYLNDQITSKVYFDIAAGYQFYKAGLFSVLSFRNPTFKTEGYGSHQTINKTSIAFEVNKYLTDYTGFAPYIGINIAFDKLDYTEEEGSMVTRELTFNEIEPGITFGWDIIPGKTDEAIILRTNLRWYPFSSFEIEGEKFNFSQLEYNLIQVVFYPNRLTKRGK